VIEKYSRDAVKPNMHQQAQHRAQVAALTKFRLRIRVAALLALPDFIQVATSHSASPVRLDLPVKMAC